MENSVQVFQYAGSSITFEKGDEVMINATEMAKSFGKLTKDFLANKSTKIFIEELSAVRGIPPSALVQIIKGGNGDQGTWMHEDVALEFARWLSPAFAIWCNDRIKELLTQGVSAITNDDEAILHAMQVLQQRVDESRKKIVEVTAEKERLQLTTEEQEGQLKSQAPKVDYYEKVLDSKGMQTTNMVAACFGISAKKLNELLCKWGVQYKQSGTYFLFAKYRERGYTQYRPFTYSDSNGETRTKQHMFWTEKGKEFIVDLYNAHIRQYKSSAALGENTLREGKEVLS